MSYQSVHCSDALLWVGVHVTDNQSETSWRAQWFQCIGLEDIFHFHFQMSERRVRKDRRVQLRWIHSDAQGGIAFAAKPIAPSPRRSSNVEACSHTTRVRKKQGREALGSFFHFEIGPGKRFLALGIVRKYVPLAGSNPNSKRSCWWCHHND